MSFWIIILLGIIQGATEFLPISSSGHLVLFYNIFGITDNTLLLSVLLHVATLFAVLFLYRKQVWSLIKNPLCRTNRLLLVATIPTVILALAFKKFIEASFSGNGLIIGFLITAILLVASDIVSKKITVRRGSSGLGIVANMDILPVRTIEKSTDATVLHLSYWQAATIGIVQGIACFPGISRSGSTISCGLLCGVHREDAADFSFLLSIPIILASLALELKEYFEAPTTLPFSAMSLVIGCIVSFVVALFCIKLLRKLVKKQKLSWFAIYLVILSIFLIANKYFLFLF